MGFLKNFFVKRQIKASGFREARHSVPLASVRRCIVLLDVACNFPGDERIYDYAIKLLRSMPDNRALIASYLGKLGDARAIEELMPLLELQELNYLDYLEIRDAIEELGGEVVKIIFLMELAGLKGRERLAKYDVASVICYEGK